VPLGITNSMEVALGPGSIVLDRDPALPPRKWAHMAGLTFPPTLLWHGRPSQQLLRSSTNGRQKLVT